MRPDVDDGHPPTERMPPAWPPEAPTAVEVPHPRPLSTPHAPLERAPQRHRCRCGVELVALGGLLTCPDLAAGTAAPGSRHDEREPDEPTI